MGLLSLLGLGGQQGQIKRGPDGQNYQYAQTTGMQGATGDNGWIRTNQQPSGGLLANLSDPLVALPLAGALMQPGGFGQNLGQGFAGAGAGMAIRNKLQKEQLAENATAKYLEAQGADPGLVELARSGGGAAALQQWSAMKKDDGLLAVGKNLYNKGTGEWIQAPAGMGGDDNEYYGTPIYVEENGKTVAYQPSKNGTTKRIELPEGSKIATGVEKLDAGTYYILKDKKTGNTIGTEPKDVAGEASAKAGGTAQGEARAMLPAARGTAAMVSQQIQDLKNDPYLPNMVGPLNSKLPNTSAAAARVQSKMDQVQGGAFLQARQMLKGGGAITDYEGQKAEAAYARMNAAQSVEDYKQALDEFNAAVQQGVAKLEAAGGGGGAVQPAAPAAPQATSSGVTWRVVP